MSDNSKIEWTDATWNPVTGCDRVSPGCDACYALTLAERFRGTPGHYFEHGFDVQLRPDKLDQPLRWKKPRKVFVNSMSDLFHKDIPDEYIAKVFAVMGHAEQHTFQVLTKRHSRMRTLLNSDDFRLMVKDEHAGMKLDGTAKGGPIVLNYWPLRNVWLGVSAENQQWADIRIPHLAHTPAAVRFLSAEPLLGPITLPTLGLLLDWVIVGGESGRTSRPMHPDWARSLRDQCVPMEIAFHFKQWGAFGPDGRRRAKGDNGRELDGRTWDEFPFVLREAS